jgi:hypothetical protein
MAEYVIGTAPDSVTNQVVIVAKIATVNFESSRPDCRHDGLPNIHFVDVPVVG